VVTVENKLQDW